MGWALCFFACLSYWSGVSSQQSWTQPASQSVSLGQMAKLSCTIDHSRAISWVQQSSGQAPRFVHCDGCSSRGNGIPDRFTASRSGTIGYLTITNVEAVDEAHYYCGAWNSAGNMWVFGGGTHLTVTGQPTVSPSVLLFPPSQEQIKTSNKATLVCLIDGFYPSNIHISWRADSTAISSGVETSQPTKQDDKYVASSYLTMSESDWEHHETYSCKVTHEGKSIEKSVNRMGYS